MTDTTRVLAVDQGTGSTRTVFVDAVGTVTAGSQVSVHLSSPRHGWVEQRPFEILSSVVEALSSATRKQPGPVAAVGISNQRESALIWDARSGEPLHEMLGWQDRRTAPRAAQIGTAAQRVRELSGLPLDPMFSALKFQWLLDEVDPSRERARRGEVRVGTVDAWLLKRLTGDDRIEVGNASRTQLMNLRTLDWDEELLDLFNIPRTALPPIAASDTRSSPISGVAVDIDGLKITGVLGDSHAALFAHGARQPGSVKVTYGTGSSIMGLTDRTVSPTSGLAESVGWSRGEAARAFEGNILSTGGTLVWLGKILGREPDELADLARHAPDHTGVNFVPAFAGLGAPWWDDDARAVIDGFDLGTDSAALARAALESIPLQIEDVLERADQTVGLRLSTVLADGGPAKNPWLMQLQADLSGRQVLKPKESGLSAVGAAQMAGLGAGLWTESDLAAHPVERTVFEPSAEREIFAARRRSWSAAVNRSRLSSTPS